MQKRSRGRIRVAIVVLLCFTMLGLTACTDVPLINDVWKGIVELTSKFNPSDDRVKEEPVDPTIGEIDNSTTPPKDENNDSSTSGDEKNDSSSDNSDGDDIIVSNEFTVTFVTNCDEVIQSQTIISGGKVAKPKDPIKISANTDYKFDGWYNGDKLWDFENDVVEEDITLIARWTVDSIYSDDYVIF